MSSDDSAVAEVTDRLWALGHRRIAALAGRASSFRAVQRLAGYRTALAGRGAQRGELVVTDLLNAAGARAAIEHLMDSADPPTAVLALNLGISTGVLLDRLAHGRTNALITLDETEHARIVAELAARGDLSTTR